MKKTLSFDSLPKPIHFFLPQQGGLPSQEQLQGPQRWAWLLHAGWEWYQLKSPHLRKGPSKLAPDASSCCSAVILGEAQLLLLLSSATTLKLRL